MTVRKIPLEEGNNKAQEKEKSKTFRKEDLEKKIFSCGNILSEIKNRIKLKEISRDEKIIDQACYKMIRYVNEGNSFTLDELKDLLNNLEHSIIALQKKKQRILEKKNRKK